MLDPDDGPLPLESLFFEKLNVHRVRPLHEEARLWQLEAPPSLNHLPATQEIQEEAESLSNLNSSLQIFETFWDPVNRPACRKVLPSKAVSPYVLKQYKKVGEETRGGSSSTSGGSGLWAGDGFRDYSQGGCHRVRGADESPQDSGHAAVSRCVSVDSNKSPLRQGSLLKIHVLTTGGDSSNMDDLSGGGGGGSQTTSTPQTFLSQVTMTTVPPPPQPPPPPATVGRAAPPFPAVAPLSPPPLGSSAASGRPPQQAPHAEMQDKGTKRAFVPPMTPRPLHIQGSSGVLRSVCEIPIKFRRVFSEFPFFNYVQSKALDDVLYTNRNFVACAPTGSGKTVLFELAIIRLLMETQEPWRDVKAVYMAPIKALCSQSFESWRKKFGPLGLVCKELTGDTEIDDFFEIQDSNIIVTTPEKWDSMTRKWRDNCLLQMVRLFLIDEVHVVKDATRGATLEVVVSRMKAVHAYRTSQTPDAGLSMRFVAVSATIPNVSDIADWLSDESGPAAYLDMDESYRPVKLKKVVLGFPCSAKQSEFMFDLSLNYKMANIIQTYSDQKPALVFCSTRKGAQQAATVLAKDARFMMSIEHKQRLMKYANSVMDSKLRDLVMLGVGYHHAGVDLSDRKTIEEAFSVGDLPVLFTTRTLAMGINLPAHLVVIKSTMQYVAGSCEEYSEADLLQMIGRAGRPQFDTSATAVIMTKIQTRDKYSKLMSGMEIIESSLHSHLVEHLNAEIVLQTISDVNMALDWIRSSFLYIRALKNPAHYGFSVDLDRHGIEAKLQELCLRNLNSLSSVGLIDMDEDINIKPSEAGRLMARYYVAYDTMKQFSRVVGTEHLSDLIELVSKSREFSHIPLRVNEKRTLNTLNRDKNRITIRFPLEGKIKTSEMKVNCLIQAQLGNITIQEFGLTQDTAKIFRNGMRVSRCLSEFLSQRSKTGFSAVINSLILAKCFRAKLWENSPFVSKQLEKIGQSLSNAMVNAGLTTFDKIEQTNPRDLEMILKRHPPFGNQIRESVLHLPKYEVTLEQLPRYSGATAEIVVKVSLKNYAQLVSRRTAQAHHYISLIIGDSDNNVVFLQKLTDLVFLKCGSWSKKIDVSKASKGEEISVNLISSEYVGLDIQHTFSLYYSAARRPETENPYRATHDRSRHRPQPSAPGQLSANQDATKREDVTTHEDPDNSQELPASCNRRECNHFCKNKNLCGHDCCKVGVTVGRKRPLSQESGFSSYLKDLRSRCDTLVETPVKRLKMKMNGEPLSVNMQEFAYQPKQMPPPISWSEGGHFGGSVRAHTEIDLADGECAQLPDVVCLSDLDRNYDDYVEDVHVSMGKPLQTASQTHHQSSSMWMIPEISTTDHSFQQRPHQVHTTSSARSSTVSRHAARCKVPSFIQVPTVSFELGSEWDDWGDFDDEELVHASGTPLSSRWTDARLQQCAENSVTDDAAASTPAFISSTPAKSWVTTSTAAPRLISSTLSPEIKKLGISPIKQAFSSQKRITLDWKKKISNTFSQEIKPTRPEVLPQQMNVGEVTRRLDFFSAVSVSEGAGSPFHRSSSDQEEEAFIGIFDGIF